MNPKGNDEVSEEQAKAIAEAIATCIRVNYPRGRDIASVQVWTHRGNLMIQANFAQRAAKRERQVVAGDRVFRVICGGRT